MMTLIYFAVNVHTLLLELEIADHACTSLDGTLLFLAHFLILPSVCVYSCSSHINNFNLKPVQQIEIFHFDTKHKKKKGDTKKLNHESNNNS